MSADNLKILALGNSLTEGFGVAPQDAYPHILQQMLEAEGIVCRLINAGVSGDTCRGVLSRLDTIPSWSPHLVILEIGVNDVLMGRWPERIQADLGGIVQRLLGWNIPVALAGMQIPPLGDPEAEAAFAAIYPAVADAFRIPLIPEFTAPLWAAPGRVQYDGLHPNAEGYRAICAHILPAAIRIIRELPSASKNPRERD
ncbi:MAG TPA: arylesterase [Desulfobacteraceae bacterium]|nr:arylesterase [Deltaproteobacteria bacterium]MBW2356298.1 arylesterase [Deltaproteobacteria bacterium]RLB93861.1 MAG: arylesterase [Deltaproteobacteria bacterium]HDI61278.1 arylesterase [Desulfobacteraceae bacterium]